SWRLNDKYEYIAGLGDQTQRSKLGNKYTFKGTFQVGKNNQIIGFLNKREKLQDKRGINLTTPLSAAYYQSSRNYPWKFEWTSVRRSLFSDQPFDIWYRDSTVGGVPNTLTQVDIFNSSVTGINDVVYTAGWINDTWKLNSRMTLNLGVRVENYKDQWPDQSLV